MNVNVKHLAMAGGVAIATLAASVSTGMTPPPQMTAVAGTVAGVATLLLVVKRARTIGGLMDSPEYEGPAGHRKVGALVRRNSRAQIAGGLVMPTSLIGVALGTEPAALAAVAATTGLAALCYMTSSSVRLPKTP